MNLYDAIDRVGASNRERVAVSFSDRKISYASLLDEADRVAAGLLRRGLNEGDRVAILSSNRPEYLGLYLAAALAGLTFLPLNPQLASSELAYILGHARPALAFASESLRSLAEEAVRRSGADIPLLSLDHSGNGWSGYRELARHAPLGKSCGGGRDCVVICYTSATTGQPKGVAISHSAEIASAKASSAVWSINEADRSLVALPLSYIYGLTTAGMASLYAGASIFLHGSFDAARVLESIERDRISIFMGVPTMYAMMLACLEDGRRTFDLTSMRLAVCSGAPLSPATAEKFARATGLTISQQYGLSEIRPVFAHPAGKIVKASSVGRRAPGVEARIIGESGDDLAPDSEGNLLVRSPTLMLGYYRDLELTASVLHGGWLDTGDRAVMDADGYFWIRGRSQEMINRGGEKVSPVEVEAVLLRHPSVREAAVVGISDPFYGQGIKAVIVLRAGQPFSRAELRQHCRAHLADFKVPSAIAVVEALPLGPTGKVSKKLLAEGV